MITVTAMWEGYELAWTEAEGENALEYALEDIWDQLEGTPYTMADVEIVVRVA